jgi:hypothetical protein
MLATASDKGTVIRVWSLPNAEKLYQLRRGSREARIHSITFNVMSTLLAVSSAHDTVHIFKLGKQGASGKKSNIPSAADPTSPSGSVDSGSAIEGGYEAFMESKQKGGMGYVSIKPRVRLGVDWDPQSNAEEAIPTCYQAVDQFCWRLSPKHHNGDLGTSTGLCLVKVTDNGGSVRGCLERHNAAGYGDFLGRILLFV